MGDGMLLLVVSNAVVNGQTGNMENKRNAVRNDWKWLT